MPQEAHVIRPLPGVPYEGCPCPDTCRLAGHCQDHRACGVSVSPPPGKEVKGEGRSWALTGGSSDYYKVRVHHPTTGPEPYLAECNDIIEALHMTFSEGNAFKAIWRSASARLGNGKPGTTARYDAEKVVFFGNRMLVMAPTQEPSPA